MSIKNKLSFFVIIIFFFLGLFSAMESSATHIVGGELTYQHVRDDIYIIRVTLRRDCLLGSPEAEFDNPASVTIFSADGARATWIQGLQPYGNTSSNAGPNGEYFTNGQLFLPFQESDTLNQFIRSDCGFEGTQVCVHETTYLGLLRLPFRSTGYILAYQRCCRNETIGNIEDPLETGSTYWTHITGDALTNQNSSPRFIQWPDVYICTDKPLMFDHSATDVDGDSLVYRLVLPYAGGGRAPSLNKPQPIENFPFPQVEWRPPFNLDNLMGGVPLQVHSQTGALTATPNLVGQYLIGVVVEEYREGKLLGIIRRDFQYNVRICSQPPLAQFSTSETNCDGLTVEFYNESLAANDFTWNFDFPNTDTSFNSKEENPIFTFPQSGVYNVRLTSVRGSDLCLDTITKEVFVFENTIVSDFSYQLIDCSPSVDSLSIVLTDLSFYNEPGFSIISRIWTVEQNGVTMTFQGDGPTVPLSYVGEIRVTLTVESDNRCQTTIEKIIDAEDLLPRSDFDFELINCPENGIAEIRLIDKSGPLNPFGVINNTTFTINGVDYSGSPVFVRLPQNTQTFDVTLLTQFETTCEISLTKTFDLSSVIPRADYFLTPVGCPEDSTVTLTLSFLDTLSNGIGATDLNWSAGVSSDLRVFSGSPFTLTIPKDSLLLINLFVLFENGCIDRINDEVLPGPFATLSFESGPVVLCPGEEKNLVVNGNPNWTYTWSPTEGLDLTNPHNPIVSVDSNRVYTVVVDDGICQIEGRVEVIALEGGIVLDIVADTITCDDKVTLTANGGVGQGDYSWGNDPNVSDVLAMGQTVTLTLDGRQNTFFVRFVGEACSTDPASITVYNEAPDVEVLSPLRLCPGDSREVVSFNLVGNHVNVFTWENNPIILSGANTSNPIIGIDEGQPGTIVLYYSVVNQFGCELKDSITVIIDTNPVLDFSFEVKDCGLYEVCFEIEGNYEGFPIWDFGDPENNDDQSLDPKPCYQYTSEGVFSITLSNNASICPFEDVVKEIVINPQISIDKLDDRVVCLGDSLNIFVNSNIENVDYVWTDENNTIINQGNSFNFIAENDTLLYIFGTDINGCIDSDTILVSVFNFDYGVNLKDTLCVDNPSEISLELDNAGDYDIMWGPDDCIESGENTTNPIIKINDEKTLSLFLRHIETGCIDSSVYFPKLYSPFDFLTDAPEIICIEQDLQIELDIENSNNFSFEWQPSDVIVSGGNTTSPVVRIFSDDTLTVIVTELSTGCFKTRSIPVSGLELPEIEVDAEPDFTIYEGKEIDIFVVDSIVGLVYEWSTGDFGTTITVDPRETTQYTVTVTDEFGCMSTDVVTVTVRNAQCDETDVYLPNAFTPNGDGVNDIFIVRSNFIEELDLIIYNRWGQEVFRTSKLNEGWDGTFKGEFLPPDSYAYYIRALCVNAEEYRATGNVTLIR